MAAQEETKQPEIYFTISANQLQQVVNTLGERPAKEVHGLLNMLLSLPPQKGASDGKQKQEA